MKIGQEGWQIIVTQSPRVYKCGFSDCGREISSEKGWHHNSGEHGRIDGMIYICPNCRRPTFFHEIEKTRTPGVALGGEVENLPEDIKKLWAEMRTSTSHGAYTAAVLSGRKLLMHIAVEQKAKENLGFIEYVDYLVDNHYAPPNSKVWVDKIRAHGNEANHKIVIKNEGDAKEIITFLEMLLRFIYEFPARGTAVTTVT
jgi:DNA-directed RNA polymerase subunit RPC12/RpoP